MSKQSEVPFSTVLASTVHDMKNSLGMLLESLHLVLDKIDIESNQSVQKHYTAVQYEASRVDSSLMQLLALYKMEQGQLAFNPGYHNLVEFLQDQVYSHAPLLQAREIECIVEAEEDLEAVFDDTLVAVVVRNILGNAIRYTHSKILLSATMESGVTIEINDNGPGYPGPMIEMTGDYLLGIDQSSGSTGLGLYFGQQVALLHSHHHKKGHIELSNGGKLGGGRFSLTLP